MRIIWLLVILGFWLPVTAHAQSFSEGLSISDFDATITLSDEDRFLVSERVIVNYTQPHHGIFRYIPYQYEKDSLWKPAKRIRISNVSVEDETGHNYPVENYHEDGSLVLKIGDPNLLVTGLKTYVITYEVQREIRFYEQKDELFWDVTGEGWPFEIARAAVTIKNVPDDETVTACYTGAFASTARNCQIEYADGVVTAATLAPLGAYENLSVAVQFNKGHITPPSFWQRHVDTLVGNLGLLAPFIFIPYVVRTFRAHGKDPKGRGVIVPQYEIPAGLSAAEMGAIYDYKVHDKDLSAQLIELAIRGHLAIHDVTKKEKSRKRDYELELLQNDTTDLHPYEQEILQGVFGTLTAGERTKLKDIAFSMATHKPKAIDHLYKRLAHQGYFSSNPVKYKALIAFGGTVMLALAFLSLVFYEVTGLLSTFGFALSGVVMLALAPFMPKRTEAGVAMYEHIAGLKLYLGTAEKERLAFHQGPKGELIDNLKPGEALRLFEKFLPAAVALGVEQEWGKAFAALAVGQTSWYRGGYVGTSNFSGIAQAASGFSHSFVSTTRVSSSGSGSSGGGFSGGGGGGGGGGGW